MNVLVTGAGGMVGRAVCRHCEAVGDQVLGLDHRALDIADEDAVVRAVRDRKPDLIINCAAWTDVDGCEGDAAHAYAANAAGPENLARAARLVSSRFVTISTDYVFDGAKMGFYTQHDDPNPGTVYGAAKLDGERRAQSAYARTIIVRSGFIFGPGGRNFLSTVVDSISREQPFKAIRNAVGTPTYALDLARRLRELAELDLPTIFHVVNGGDGASYEEFARVASELTGQQPPMQPVTDESLGRPAKRPANSRLRCLFIPALGLRPLRSWQEALQDYVGLSRANTVGS